MKKYLFGLGAMMVGAGLMFVLMHGEVSVESDNLTKFTCKGKIIRMQAKDGKLPMAIVSVCTGLSSTQTFPCRYDIESEEEQLFSLLRHPIAFFPFFFSFFCSPRFHLCSLLSPKFRLRYDLSL